jgi:hypothetical protein
MMGILPPKPRKRGYDDLEDEPLSKEKPISPKHEKNT